MSSNINIKKFLIISIWVLYGLILTSNSYSQNSVNNWNKPIPPTAKKSLAKSNELIIKSKYQEAEKNLRQAIRTAPHYVNAHATYIELKSLHLFKYDEVRKEYENLMKKEPNNPVYPMALAIARYQVGSSSKNRWLKTVLEIAPEWSWSHYARGMLLSDSKPKEAVEELNKYINADGTWMMAYYSLAYIQNNVLDRLEDAISTIEKMSSRLEAYPSELNYLWQLKLGKVGGNDKAKAELLNELKRYSLSQDVNVLNAVQMAYSHIMEDEEKSLSIERKIRRIDPTWYPERGKFTNKTVNNVSGITRSIVATNERFTIINEIAKYDEEIEAAVKIEALEKLLMNKNSTPEIKRHIYELIFRIAEKSNSTETVVKYGNMLYEIDPEDVAIPAKISIVLANKGEDLKEAERYAQIAEKATSKILSVTRPANNGYTDEEWNELLSKELQQQFYQRMRALALNSLGFTASKKGNFVEAEKM